MELPDAQVDLLTLISHVQAVVGEVVLVLFSMSLTLHVAQRGVMWIKQFSK